MAAPSSKTPQQSRNHIHHHHHITSPSENNNSNNHNEGKLRTGTPPPSSSTPSLSSSSSRTLVSEGMSFANNNSTASTTATAASIGLKTPTKNNNYAAPHTPIASAKRPRGQNNNNNNNSNRNLIKNNTTTTAQSSSSSTHELSYKTPPKVTAVSLSGEEKENVYQQQQTAGEDSASGARIMTTPERIAAAVNEDQMSPMHPPRPVRRRDAETEESDDCSPNPAIGTIKAVANDVPDDDGVADTTEQEDEEEEGGWKSKVDQLFSPVLSFLGGGSNGSISSDTGSNDATHPHPRLVVDADGDVTMTPVDDDDDDSMRPSTAPTVSYSTVGEEEEEDSSDPSVVVATDFSSQYNNAPHIAHTTATGSHQEYDSYSTTLLKRNDDDDDDRSVKEQEENGHHNGNVNNTYERYNNNNSDNENEDDNVKANDNDDNDEEYEDDEEEFNPYLFIKSLPPYSQVVSHPNHKICLPPKTKSDPPIALVLDLDETLVHCTVEPTSPNADMIFPVVFNGMEYRVHVRTRPYLSQFLELVSKKFEVIVFTASQKVYADELLDRIDPGRKHIKHRMFRESCLPVEGNYLKDLNVLGRDLRKVVLVDNSPHAFGYQVDNGIPIESWFDNPHDTELLKLERFLRTLHGMDDVRNAVRARFQTYKLIMDA